MNALSPRRTRESRQPSAHRGSWMDKLDPGQIVHWEMNVTLEQGRRLKAPRYRNYIIKHGANPDDPEIQQHGFRIEVRPHTRKQAMSLARLKHHLTRVIAKGREGEQEALVRTLEEITAYGGRDEASGAEQHSPPEP